MKCVNEITDLKFIYKNQMNKRIPLTNFTVFNTKKTSLDNSFDWFCYITLAMSTWLWFFLYYFGHVCILTKFSQQYFGYVSVSLAMTTLNLVHYAHGYV